MNQLIKYRFSFPNIHPGSYIHHRGFIMKFFFFFLKQLHFITLVLVRMGLIFLLTLVAFFFPSHTFAHSRVFHHEAHLHNYVLLDELKYLGKLWSFTWYCMLFQFNTYRMIDFTIQFLLKKNKDNCDYRAVTRIQENKKF